MATPEPFVAAVITLVPEMWAHLLVPGAGRVGEAFARGHARLHVHSLRDYGEGPHRRVDDAPFGGGAGMVLQVGPLHAAIQAARARTPAAPVVLLSPRGERLGQPQIRALAAGPGVTLICGRYEGVDERVGAFVDQVISVGDFVLSGGDPAALCLLDATVRLLPGVLGNAHSLQEESFAEGLLEYPQYTRPATYAGMAVPAVLRSGDHAAVAAWRAAEARALTARHRPDLMAADGPCRPPHPHATPRSQREEPDGHH